MNEYIRFLKAEAKRNLLLATYNRIRGRMERWELHMRHAHNYIKAARVLS